MVPLEAQVRRGSRRRLHADCVLRWQARHLKLFLKFIPEPFVTMVAKGV